MPGFRRPFVPLRQTRGAEISLITLAFFFPVAAGCVSNEYVIPKDELMHQAQMPASARGQRVRVVQDLGGRRGDAVPVSPPPPPVLEAPPVAEGEQPADVEGDPDAEVGAVGDDGTDGNIDLRFDSSGSGRGPRRMPTMRNATVARPSGGWRGPGQPARAGGGRVGGGHVGGGGRLGGGGGRLGGGGGRLGGGGGGGDALVALAVLAIVIGVVIGVGLVSGEGMRFDGYVALAPEQPIHIKDGFGRTRELPLATLSPDDVLATVEAKVMDDEGYGIERLDRLPLDRTGGTFKLDSGATTFGLGPTTFSGPMATIQLGYFFTRRTGLLMNLGLGGASDDQGMVVTRHTLSLELQHFPLSKGRVHLGGYADAGFALAGITTNDVVSGPAGGGGALVELDLTSRMALTLRAGGSLAHLDNGWSPAGVLALGVALY